MATSNQVRQVPVHVLTSIGWVSGTLRVPRLRALVEHLDHDDPYLTIHGARVPGRSEAMATFLLHKSAAVVVVPLDDTDLELMPTRGREPQHVACVLREGLVEGEVTTPQGAPLEGFVLHHPGFLLLRHARVALREGQEQRLPSSNVIVNARRVVGIADLQPAPAPQRTTRAPRAADLPARPAR